MSERVLMMNSGDGTRRADNGCRAKGPVVKTAAYTIKAGDTGTCFSNLGAAGSVTFTLPAPKKGFFFMFIKPTAQDVVIQAPAGTKVAGSTAAKAYQNVTGGDAGTGVLELFCDGTDYWNMGSIGTWAINNT